MFTPHSTLSASPAAPTTVSDLTVLGDRTVHRAVQAPGSASQLWLDGAPLCPVLPRYNILHLGIVDAFAPYCFLRRHTRAFELLACFGGEGRILIEGRWRIFRPGYAALLPQDAAAGYHAIGDEAWRLVWVCYRWPARQEPLLAPASPILAEHDPKPLLHAVEGLRHECLDRRGETACMEHWCALVHRQMLRLARPRKKPERLRVVWEKVAASLDEDWTVDRLAAEAGCCGEALRRSCQRQLGRSPMQHLTQLRLQRAAELLLTTDHKVEHIAASVGYGDPFAFSAMFKKRTGHPPGRFRERFTGRERPPSG